MEDVIVADVLQYMFFCYSKSLVFISSLSTSSTDKEADTAVPKNNAGESHIISNPLTAESKREKGEEKGREDTELDLAVQGITVPDVQYS